MGRQLVRSSGQIQSHLQRRLPNRSPLVIDLAMSKVARGAIVAAKQAGAGHSRGMGPGCHRGDRR